MEAIHAVNAVHVWQPGEQAQNKQTEKHTNRPDDYYAHGLWVNKALGVHVLLVYVGM